MINSSDNQQQKPILRVLALDGGGVRGLILLRFLQAVEEATEQRTHEIFHTIAGTSTGGLVTALLTLPQMSPEAKNATTGQDPQNAKDLKNGKKVKGPKGSKEVKMQKGPKHDKTQPPTTAGEALALYKENGPEIFPLGRYLLKKWLKFSLPFLLGGVYIFRKFRASPKSLSEYAKMYVHLLQTKPLAGVLLGGFAGVLALPLFGCVSIALKSVFHVIERLFNPSYTAGSVHKFCKKHFPVGVALKDAKANVGIVATDVQKNRTFVFNSMRAKIDTECMLHNAFIGSIARATSAAPTFFLPETVDIVAPKPGLDPKKWRILKEHLVKEMTPWDSRDPETLYDRPKIEFEDGGTKMNNPSKVALKLAQLQLKEDGKNPDDYEIRLLSVGTGSLSGEQDDPTGHHEGEYNANKGVISRLWKKLWAINWNGGLLGVVKRRLTGDVFEVMTNAHNDHLKMKQYFKEIGNPEGYRRQQFKISEHQLNEMDDCSDENMEELIKCAENMLFTGGDIDQEQNEREWSGEFKECIDFLGLKIIKQPGDILHKIENK